MEFKIRIWDADLKKMHCIGNMTQPTEGLTTMFFTGFLDKHDQELYEGDIVTFKHKNINNPLDKLAFVKCIVVWNPLGMWSLKWADGYINNAPLNLANIPR